LADTGAQVQILERIHSKTLAIDDRIIVEGSFNWLSAVRNPTHPWSRHEVSLRYAGRKAGAMISSALEELETRIARPRGKGERTR